MRLPNGYGSVTKLSGHRRKPFMIKKTVGFNDKGQPLIKIIGYAETRESGLQMLAEYNHNPYDVDTAKITLKELYKRFCKSTEYKNKSESFQRNFKTSFNKSKPLHNKRYRDIKKIHMQTIVDEAGKYASQSNVKNFFYNLDRFAFSLDIINKKYSELLTLSKNIKTSQRTAFTEKEINILWEHSDDLWAKHWLCLIYSGFRISEYLSLTSKTVDLKNMTFKAGVKTTAGKNRIVPIHHRIQPIVINLLKSSKDGNLAIGPKNYIQTVAPMRISMENYLNEINIPKHVLHEARHTFRSLLDNKNGNVTSINRLMGHVSGDVGQDVYTHKTIKQLRETIELID